MTIKSAPWMLRILVCICVVGIASWAVAQPVAEKMPEAKTPAKKVPEAAAPSSSQTKATPGAEPALLPKVRICTAQQGNNYYRYGKQLEAKLKGIVSVAVIDTRGSWENLELIDANPRRCDAVIAQEDAYTLHHFEKPNSGLTMDRTATLYPEYVHILCHRNIKANKLSELDPEKHGVIVNQYGSGSYITWRLFRRLNPDYKRFKLIEKNVDEGMLRLLDGGQPACLFFVSGLGGRTLSTADKTFGDQLKLLTVDDPKLTRQVGRDRRQIYRLSSIAGDIYQKLNTKRVVTPSVSAVFFTSPEWKARYPKAAQKLASALLAVIAESRK